MKSSHLLDFLRQRDTQHIARFGDAELVRHLNGHYELNGGTGSDHRAAREWVSLFMHDAVLPRAGGQ